MGTNGLARYLAAVYLNAFYGFFDGTTIPGGGSTVDDWVYHFNAMAYTDDDWEANVFGMIFHTAATTGYTTDCTSH